MANEKALVSMAEQFSGLPMRDLIGAPLMAAAEANNAMAVTQTKFILDTCFKAEGENDSEKLKPIMIKMTVKRGVILAKGTETKIEQVETEFELPLLTILPLNSLGVDDVSVAFNMEVKSSYGESTSQEEQKNFKGSGSFSAKLGYGIFSAEVSGSVSYENSSKTAAEMHYEKSNTATYDVKVHAGQIKLPPGVTTIIQFFTKSIDPIKVVDEGGKDVG